MKTVCPKGRVGSNPTPSANKTHFCRQTKVRFFNDVCLRQMMLALPMMTLSPMMCALRHIMAMHHIAAGDTIIEMPRFLCYTERQKNFFIFLKNRVRFVF